MRYRELLELYRKKELGEQEREMVEQEIEKHEAISEYLFEREESDTLNFGEDASRREDADPVQKRKEDAGGDEFTKRVNRAIRRAFLRMGAAVCAVTLVIVLLILFVLPGVVSQFYYDPGKIVGQDSYGGTTNQMSLDMQCIPSWLFREPTGITCRSRTEDTAIMIFPFIRMSAGRGAFRIRRGRSGGENSGCMTSISSACLCPMPLDGFRWIWIRREL